MNYEQEYNKLFEYFADRTQDKSRIKTSDELIQTYSNYDVLNIGDYTDLYDCQQSELEKEIKVLEDLTLIIEELKIGLIELRKSNTKKACRKFDELIELANTRKSIYCSENDEPPERPEGFGLVGTKILEPKFSEVYSDEVEETIQDNEIPDW